MLRKITLSVVILSLICRFVSFAMVDASHGPTSDAPFGPGPFAENPGETVSGAASLQNAAEAGGRVIDPSKPMLALTYDDGPQVQSGNRIMDAFIKAGQRCTFFVVGDRVSSRAEEMKRMADEGFEIGNHTYSHKYLNKCDAETIRSQVAKCNEAVQQYTGVTPVLMRLPGGNKNDTVLQNVNMPIIMWNVDTLDWSTRDAQKTIDAVMGKVKDGDIVLMHELYSSTADATEYIVPKLVEQGFQLVTVSELAKYKNIELAANKIYYSLK